MPDYETSVPTSIKAAYVAGIFLGVCTILSNMWCFVVILSARKLRKPLWLFRASLSLKDVIISMLLILPIVFGGFNEIPYLTTKKSSTTRGFDFGHYMAIALISCVSSSIFTLLCMSIDRYHASSRPFRYHTGGLMPPRVAVVSILYCWLFGILCGISVATDYANGAQRVYGILLRYVATEPRQKWLLLGGLSLVYAVAAALFIMTLLKVYRQKRKIRLRMIHGEPEQIRSERNSFSEEPLSPRRFSPKRHRSDSESDADFFFNTEDDYLMRKKRKWSLTVTQKITFFTPTSYRPSILRRIRDTWYLYIAIWTCVITLFGTMIPMYFAVAGGEYCENPDRYQDGGPRNSSSDSPAGPSAATPESSALSPYCSVGVLCDCLLLCQGCICVILYSFTDDVFRPKFLRPIRFLVSKMNCVQTEPKMRTSYRQQRNGRRSSSWEVSEVR